MKNYTTKPDFSIITPVYNGGEWVRETLDSVLATCRNFNFEYIVVNDGSTDETESILADYQDDVIVVSQENQGEASSVNNGLLIAKGDYVLIVSADDPMRSPDLLSHAKNIFESDESVVCVYPNWSVIDSDSSIIRDVEVIEFNVDALIGEFNCIVGPGGIFRRSAALQVSGRNSKLKFTSDYDFWLKLSQVGSFRKIPYFLAYWREHDNSTSISQRGVEMGRERILVVENFLRYNPQIQRTLAKKGLGYAYFHAALLKYFDTKVPGRKWLLVSLWKYPRGLIEHDLRIMLYICLFPMSSILLKIMKQFHIYPKLSRRA